MLTEKFWTKYFADYDVLNELIPYQDLIETLCTHLNIQSGDLVLDAGAGTGNVGFQIMKKGGTVIGFDFSHEGLARHKMKMPGAEALYGDLSKTLPFSDNYFDKIVSNNTIYTIQKEKRSAIFDEFYRVLKPGGIIVVANIIVGFSPRAIYLAHVKEDVRRRGWVSACVRLLKFALPTLRIFYYNYLIKKENKGGAYDFFEKDEQVRLLSDARFSDISKNIFVYADNAVLNSARK